MKKDTNPKDALGVNKAPMSTVPATVMSEIGLAMLEGSIKYGSHNYRVMGVRASVYYDAAMRHLMAWWEGEDQDPDSKMSHIPKAIASLTVLRDAMIQEKLVDDRPPKAPAGWVMTNNQIAKAMLKGKISVAPFTERPLNRGEDKVFSDDEYRSGLERAAEDEDVPGDINME